MLPCLIDTSLFIENKYEKISDNVYLIRGSEGESYKLHRDDLIYSLKELHQYSHIFIDKLKPEQLKLFNGITEATRILHNNKVLQDLVLKDIKKIYKDITTPVPGTVAAFFVGCFNNDHFKGPLGCNPRCAASFISCDKEQLACEDNIYIFKDGQFVKLNKKNYQQPTEHVYIYIDDHLFTDFQLGHLVTLRRSGVKKITVIYSNEDGTYKNIEYNKDISHIPITNSSMSAGWIILIILVIILILLIAAGVFYFR